MSQTCTMKGCGGKLASLYYKVGTRWIRVGGTMICIKCERLYLLASTLTPFGTKGEK